MKVVIVGAGIGGLGAAVALTRAGHDVEVYERSSFCNEVGAAIHVQPNSTRVLKSWGCDLRTLAAVPCESIDSYSGTDLKLIDKTAIRRELQALSGVDDPWLLVHRVDLHNALRKMVADGFNGRAAKIHLNSKVQSVDAATGEVRFEDGNVVRGDLVVGADGLHSRAVKAVAPEGREKITTGRDVFRFMVPVEKAQANPVTRVLLARVGMKSCLRFYTPGLRVIVYPCRSNTLINIVAVCAAKHPQSAKNETSWVNPGTIEDLLTRFKEMAPELQTLFKMAEDLKCWSLVTRLPPRTFIKQRLALLGDAAHPMLPHHGQGSAQALEDAAALGSLFSGPTASDEVSDMLKIYNEVRYNHAVTVSFLSRIGNVHCDEVLDDLREFVPDATIPENAWVYAWTSYPAVEVKRLLAIRSSRKALSAHRLLSQPWVTAQPIPALRTLSA
ncbi:FAD/NAD(P)-binding domain-containing protein [Xylariaceae sp. FL1272]|nr:FAD/NAD(P)-binding domain-containing protein [Xylariaceae sp. FL1272]